MRLPPIRPSEQTPQMRALPDVISERMAQSLSVVASKENGAQTGPFSALLRLPRELAIVFCGVLSFWTAGEISDDRLASDAREVAEALLRGLRPYDQLGRRVPAPSRPFWQSPEVEAALTDRPSRR